MFFWSLYFIITEYGHWAEALDHSAIVWLGTTEKPGGTSREFQLHRRVKIIFHFKFDHHHHPTQDKVVGTKINTSAFS